MSLPSETKPPAAVAAPHQPLIPEKYLDIPSQRLYYLSLGLLCQAIKILDVSWYWTTGHGGFSKCKKWLFVDLAYCVVLSKLRIPRLTYSKVVVLLQICLLWFLDGVIFGGITLNMAATDAGSDRVSTSSSSGILTASDSPSFLGFRVPSSLQWFTSSPKGDPHLLGQHTVRMSPISTAQFHTVEATYCLAPPDNFVLIPVVLNNTNPSHLQYSLTPLGHLDSDKTEYVNLTMKDFRNVEQLRLSKLKIARPAPSTQESDYDEEYDDEETWNVDKSQLSLQNTQSIVYIHLNRPGTLRLEHVTDASNNVARIAYPSEITIVPCPRAEIIQEDSPQMDVRCVGHDANLNVLIDITGVPPLSLRWIKTINGKSERFLVEGIENGQDDSTEAVAPQRTTDAADSRQGILQWTSRVPQRLKIPITIPLTIPGTYLFALEEVIDGVGNSVRAGVDGVVTNVGDTPFGQTKVTRSLIVLERPEISFRHCGISNPTSLLIGSDVILDLSIANGNEYDAPWEVELKYQPPAASAGVKASKRLKPWKKVLQTQGARRDLEVRASAPGDYTIGSIHGKWCNGDVLIPETCRVVERPFPTAQIEWKKIHECSGDTGVSASLILRGTPPFQVYYEMQRDNEPAREFSRTFTSARGELTLQPEKSGHYVFTFVRMSDANYKAVELNGPSIDQVVHPLAAADFVASRTGKRIIDSCEGGKVDVDVELRGTGPWNLDLQIVGPNNVENILIAGIEASPKTLQIPVPKSIDEQGGSFDINIVGIEDAYKCKRPITASGITVNVRRIKPTAKFYGGEGYQTTVLERETASLPLRLTGDGPWRVKYRRVGSDEAWTKMITNPNAHLTVTQKGRYEILEVADSQCPGNVIADGATYKVDWLARPSATLSPRVKSMYIRTNGSYVLPPVCEGTDNHVDLDLTGHPPFQITYNVAQATEGGGTRLLDQPTFNSIQPHTRFQLHTANAGRIYYEVKQVGDSAYPLSSHKNTVIPRHSRLLFEQEVLMRPSARFQNRNRMSHCLNDRLVPIDPYSMDGTVLLEGSPPFQLQLSIKHLGSSQVDIQNVEVKDRTWRLDLPSFVFESLGPYLVTITSVYDSSNCAPSALDPLSSSIWIDVAETAAIIPFDRRVDFCVGETALFQLEGIPPWTVGYRINGKSHTQEVKVSPFSLPLQQPGEFAITSIAHQQKMCRATVTDLKFNVHSLPSAQVGHGKRIYQDIHEGDQAEIVFSLSGEPPFTFTYQRAEIPKKGGAPGRVLETHTVSRIMATEYSVFSALEGTWTVTSISDRYCRYPSAPPESEPR